MFHFKSLEMMNWDCYPHYRVPLDGEIVLLVGQNGSGKTTFLDALRVLLNATRLSKNRTLHHYIQKDVKIAMIKAVVTNKLVGQKRPFAHLGIYGDVDVSLVCMVYNHGAQKIDKEYFILKGDIPTDELSKLKNGLKPLQYSRHLEESGLSRSTLKLIALEQGQTDRIGQLGPNDLLQMVMDITGNRDIIKKYEIARSNYQQTFQQLIELQTEYNKTYEQTQQLGKQAREAQTYKESLQEKDIIEREKLPLAKWYQVLNRIHEAERTYQELLGKKENLTRQISTIPQEEQLLLQKQQKLEHQQQEIRDKQLQQERRLNLLHQQIGRCNSEWQMLDELRRSCEELAKEISPEQVTTELEEMQSQYYRDKNEVSQLQNELNGMEKELVALRKDLMPTYPNDVTEFRDMLSAKKIENLLFAECIEITDAEWQLAIEAFLGRERFSLFVAPEDFLKAKKMGEKHRYGFYISRFCEVELPGIRSNSILEQLKILDRRIGERLLPLNDVMLVKTVEEGHKYHDNITVTIQGYRQDRRGGIFIAHKVRFYCGGLAVERESKELEDSIAETSKRIEGLHQSLHQHQTEIRNLEEQLANIKKKEQWESSRDRHQTLKEEGQKLMAESEAIVKERNQLGDVLDQLVVEKNKCLSQQREFQRDLGKIQQEQQQISEALIAKEQILLQLRWEKEELDKKNPKETTHAYTPDQLEPIEWLERKLKEIDVQLETFTGCRDFAMIGLYDHESKQLDMKKRELSRMEEDYNQRFGELEKCREDYRQMIVHTINFYNKAVRELGDLAGCRIRVLLELGGGDSLIEEAKLYVRVSFDQKAEVDIHDKSLSGGQDVIASLILLVALSRIEKEESSGFFIMDEHNAHLDMLRIMEVGHFLRSTKAQFVLTTPTTENMAALSVADLIVTFTKKSSDSVYAPKPRFIRRV